MRKPKMYQVVVTANEQTLFDATNKREDVDKWLDMVDQALTPMSVQVYKFNEHSYELVAEKARVQKPEYRPVGFCRGW